MDVVWITGGLTVGAYAAGAVMGYMLGRKDGMDEWRDLYEMGWGEQGANRTVATDKPAHTRTKPPVDKPAHTRTKPPVDKPALMLAARMRKYRARKRKALKLYEEGLTPKGIAREMGVTTASVRGYLRKEPRDAPQS